MEHFCQIRLWMLTLNAFKARLELLDKFWLQQEVMFDFTADLSGTRN